MKEALHKELLAMEAEDLRVREDLKGDGSLFHGYHPRMEAVHRANAARLSEIIAAHGWPGRSLAGEDGAEAAWRIAQHAISELEFLREALRLLQQAVEQGEAPAWQSAFMLDRIRVLEGRPQVFGTQFDWGESGPMIPLPIENPEHVNERRKAIGLPSLEEALEKHRADFAPEKLPEDWKERQEEMAAWARRVGWRK